MDERTFALEQELWRRKAQSNLLAFTKATKPDFEVNWHHRAICRAINYLYERRTPRELLASWGIHGKELDRQLSNPHPVTKLYAGCTRPEIIDEPMTGLQVHIQPRSGKSEIITRRMPAWWLGKNPDAQLIATGYSANIASAGNRAVQRIISEPSYKAIFPKTVLPGLRGRDRESEHYVRNTDLFEIVGRRGVYRNSGVGGPITGAGANVVLCDDVLKNYEDANSPAITSKLWEWWTSTLYTRLEKHAVRFILNTRWSQRDLSERTIEQARNDPDADQWFCLVYPSILDCEPGPGDCRAQGDALWEGKYNVAKLKQIRASIGTRQFEALYQQRPQPMEGGIVKQAWWQFYTSLPEGLSNWLISVDLAFKGTKNASDFCAMQVWACRGPDRYLIDQVCERLEFTEQLRAFKALCAKWPQCQTKLIEDAANGAALVSLLKREIQGVIAVPVRDSKEARLEAVAPQIEAGNVWLPNPQTNPWVEQVMSQVQYLGSVANDDCADALSLALGRLTQKYVSTWEAMPYSIGPNQSMGDASPGRQF